MATNLNKFLEGLGPFGIEPMSKVETAEAKALLAAYRARHGFKEASADLLTEPSANVKLSKSETPGYSLSLAPASSSGVANVCNRSTPACRAHCVAFAGNGMYPAVGRGRSWKVELLHDYPAVFVRLLADEIRKASRKGPITMRLNTFSDLRWENIAPDLFTLPNVSFYDYTKWSHTERANRPDNYNLTFSATERTTTEQVRTMVAAGENVAVIVSSSRHAVKPDTWEGMPAVDGDKTDDRTLDKRGVVVLLTAKGSLRRATDEASVKFRHG